jgi:two-component system chemotaxis response regulator CheB
MTTALVVIGTSLGGFNALATLLARLPAGLSTPIAVVQHRSAGMDGSLAALLGEQSALRILDAEDKMTLDAGQVYLAPPDYHLLIEGSGMLSLSTDPPVHYARPSIDVLFETAARVFGSRLLGIVMTGASSDGAQGLQAVAARGGEVIVQDPQTAECPVMPQAALAATPSASVCSLDGIAHRIVAFAAGVRT